MNFLHLRLDKGGAQYEIRQYAGGAILELVKEAAPHILRRI